MSDLECSLGALAVHPIKSCAGIAPDASVLWSTGLDLDRAWMVVDRHGDMLTQRERPRMVLVQPQLRWNELVVRAPGMLALHLALDAVEAPLRVRVWDDAVMAFDMGAVAGQWFSDFLGQPGLRLVRFDPDRQRMADRRWTGDVDAEIEFADGFPLLVASTASLAELNRRLADAGAAAVPMARFRPNLVLDGLPQPHDEDHIDTLEIAADDGPVTLRLVKPCTRCSIPDIDPATAEPGQVVARTLAGYRADARMGGAITFGMNAIVVSGAGAKLTRGAAVSARFAV